MNLPIRLALAALLAAGAAGCADNLLPPGDVPPACASPAPLLGEKSTAPGYVVVFREGTDAVAVTRRLAEKHVFKPRHVYQYAIQGFSADMSGPALAGVRCEPQVRFVEHNGIVSVD